MRKNKNISAPTLRQIETELRKEEYRSSRKRILRGSISTLIVIAAATVLISTFLLPVVRIYGTSMDSALDAGDIVVIRKKRFL